MSLEFFAGLLKDYWFILVPLVLISGVESRKKNKSARTLQVIVRIVGFIAAAVLALGILGWLTR